MSNDKMLFKIQTTELNWIDLMSFNLQPQSRE